MKIIALLVVLLICSVGLSSATDYYASTAGNNTSNGLSIGTAWMNVSYGVSQLTAGDTLYLINGEWNNEPSSVFADSGNATHRIIVTAHNGTPVINGGAAQTTVAGLNINNKDYITISNITVKNYRGLIGYGSDSGNNMGSNILIQNCTLSDSPYIDVSNAWGLVYISGVNSTNNTIENCTLYNSGWNTIQAAGNRHVPVGSGVPSTHIKIINNKIYNSNYHGCFDLFGNLDHVTIEGNEYYNSSKIAVYTHDTDIVNYVTINNNNFHDLIIGTDRGVIELGAQSVQVNHSTISNNVFSNIVGYSLYLENAYNQTIRNNSVYNVSNKMRSINCDEIVFDRNFVNSDAGGYFFTTNGTDIIVRNPLGVQSVYIYQNVPPVTLEWDDNTVFTATANMDYSEFIPIRYYPSVSNCSIIQSSGQSGGSLHPVSSYNITLKPTSGYLKNVVLNEFNTTTEIYNITINSTDSENPTWINATVTNASSTYNISRDGIYYDTVVSGSDSVARYYYNIAGDEWSEHTFEFTWASSENGVPETSYTVGINGANWAGNSTMNNLSEYDENTIGLYSTNIISHGNDSGSWDEQTSNLRNSYSDSDNGERVKFDVNVSNFSGYSGSQRNIVFSNDKIIWRMKGENVSNQYRIYVRYNDSSDLWSDTYNSTSGYQIKSLPINSALNVSFIRIYFYPRLLNNTYSYYLDWMLPGGFSPTTGNLITWYDAGSGNETYQLWFNTTSTQNHSDYYRENNTGSYVLLGANQIGNQSYTLSTKYQNTQPRTILHGNTTETSELISITFKTQTTEETAIETFVVAVGAFVAVVVAGAAVVSRRVRRGIGRFVNQRIGRW